MSSIHLDAAAGSIADAVLLPGDPLRAEHIATTLLERPLRVNGERNMLGFTGEWQGLRVSVLGTGMGIPSTLIYATELIQLHQVRRLVRLGTCGAIAPSLGLGDLVLATAAGTDSAVNRHRFGGMDLPAAADFRLTAAIAGAARRRGLPLATGTVFSTDLFHGGPPGLPGLLDRMGILAVEMEAAGLFALAAEHRVAAAALLTVSDHLVDQRRYGAQQRRTGLDDAARVALDALLAAAAGNPGSDPA